MNGRQLTADKEADKIRMFKQSAYPIRQTAAAESWADSIALHYYTMLLLPRIFSRHRRSLKCWLTISAILFCCVFVGAILIRFGWKSRLRSYVDPEFNSIKDSEKVVLFWTTFFGTDHYGIGLGRTPFINCPVSNCRTTRDRRLLSRSVALIFHPVDMDLTDMPSTRRGDQRWIFYTLESPNLTPDVVRRLPSKSFNWTMTYRTDSDVYLGYSLVRSEETLAKFPHVVVPSMASHPYPKSSVGSREALESWRPLIRGKTKKVAWFVSHCWTAGQREKYVSQLRQFIDVDVYGWCGDLQCPHGTDCYEMLRRDYKFYLAFENALCVDYVTEKFFNVLNYDVVPIVYGGADYSKIAPNMSYIDVRDFQSPRHLADYLHYLDGNEDEYLRYFSWRPAPDEAKAIDDWFVAFMPFCTLCQMLNQQEPPLPAKSYADLASWWFDEGQCGRDFPLFQRLMAYSSSSFRPTSSTLVITLTFIIIQLLVTPK